MSASTHIPPTGIHCPASTRSRIAANNSGCRSSIHAYCWAWEQLNRYAGSCAINSIAEENVRVHLRTVSCSGHNHAVSMWAWPVAIMR